MTSAFCPDDAPPRLFRYLPKTEFPHDEVLATLDKTSNILRINKDLFDNLSWLQKHLLLRTHRSIVIANPTTTKKEAA
ncbi:hypothetical protein [Pseudolabrys sp.]|uniref:hypothetical protein n=1 Tax=Pseudolabrys sp. TaxID=1960880 RepID=UPI003D145B6A